MARSLEAIGTLYGDIDELFLTKLRDAYSGMGSPCARSLAATRCATCRPTRRRAPPAPVAAPSLSPAAASADAPAAAAPAVAAPAHSDGHWSRCSALPALRLLGKGIADAARAVRSGEPTSAWAFRLARIGTWLAVNQPPPAEGGKDQDSAAAGR